jgi:hypothetical protein
MPKLVDTLEKLPQDQEVHIHIQDLGYIDHACLEAIGTWEKQRNDRSAKTVVEWEELMAKYRRMPQMNPNGSPSAVEKAG